MADRNEGTGGMPDRVGLGESVSARTGLGDDQGTRIGEPTPGTGADASAADGNQKERGETQSGKEASKGIRDANRGGSADAPGSEPLTDRSETHQSEYGGGGATKRGQNKG